MKWFPCMIDALFNTIYCNKKYLKNPISVFFFFQRPQKEELAKIKNHLQKEGAADLDKPEQ